jgi:hypothetical protein
MVSALGALETAGAAATATLERPLAGTALGAMGRVTARPLRVALAATIGLRRASFALPLVIPATFAAGLDRGARRGWPGMAMATVAAASAGPAPATTALVALGHRQLERLQRLNSGDKTLR